MEREFRAIAAAQSALRIAMEVAAIEDQMVRKRRVDLRRRAELDELVEKDIGARADLDADEAIVMRARRGGDDGSARRRPSFGIRCACDGSTRSPGRGKLSSGALVRTMIQSDPCLGRQRERAA